MWLETVLNILNQIWQVWLDTALWLCLGLLFAAVAHVYLRTEYLQRWLARPGPGSIIRAALLGAPLPLCSCGVLPAAIGLRRAGASKEASAAFLISTPETGVDSITVSYALLGPVFALLRPVAALTTAVAAGLAVWRWDSDEPASKVTPSNDNEASCCGGHEQDAADEASEAKQGLLQGLQYAFTKLLDDLAGWLVVGVVLAGLILAVLPPELLAAFGQSAWALPLMLVVGVPLYVCAVASTPIAAALLVAGVSPGAVLVFLLAGPATNLGGLMLISNEFGRRFATIYLLAISSVALILGYALDFLFDAAYLSQAAVQVHEHATTAGPNLWAAVALMLWLLYRRLKTFLNAR